MQESSSAQVEADTTIVTIDLIDPLHEARSTIQGEAKAVLVRDLPNDLYHAAPGVSQSQLKILANRSPAHLRYSLDNPSERKSAKALDIGTYFHCFILEPQHFYSRYAVLEEDAPKRPTQVQRDAVANWFAWEAQAAAEPAEKPKRKSKISIVKDDELIGEVTNEPSQALAIVNQNESEDQVPTALDQKIKRKPTKPAESTFEAVSFWDRFDRDNADKEVIDAATFAQLQGMATALLRIPAARALLQNIETEASVWFWSNGTLCRTRFDGVNIPLKCVIDLKTCQDASESEFARSVASYDYDIQAATYLEAAEAVGIDARSFVFICVEKSPPYGVGLYQIAAVDLESAKREFHKRRDAYAACLQSGKWPGYPDNVKVLDMPAWHRKQRGTAVAL